MTPSLKDCGKHGTYCRRRRLIRRTVGAIVTITVLILLAILIVWLVLRPSKPKFYLQDATVLAFNLSSPNLLSSKIQVTISSRNPNDNIGVLYDKLDVYASYHSQQITIPTAIPPFYQGHNDVNVWSPYLIGDYIPIAPYMCSALNQDMADGFFFLNVKMDGRVRWKVGSWKSDHYHIFVNCPAYLTFDDQRGGAIWFRQISKCSVEV